MEAEKLASRGVFVVLVIILLLLGVMAFYSFTGKVLPLLVVKTGSMEPTLNVGDVILIDEGVRPEEIRTGPQGDVIVFYKPGTRELIVHRAVGWAGGGFITKGDANPGIDLWAPVPPENLVGKWTGFKIPYWTGVGYASLFLRGEIYPPYGRILLLTLIILNIALIVRDLAERKED